MDATRQDISLQVAGETLQLLPERAVFWPDQRMLLLSDLHWGKSETFRQHGIPIPPAVFDADLARLDGLIHRTGAAEILVLGDLIHTKLGVTPGMDAQVREWRQGVADIRFRLIPGNHDRPVKPFLASWDIDLAPEELDVGPFRFSHHPDPHPGTYVFSGHVHPTIRMRSGSDKLRLPCFHIGELVGVLPAFGAFTGGWDITPNPTDRIFVIADDQVIPL